MTTTISAREALADSIREKCVEFCMNDSYGANVFKDSLNGKSYYAVSFCIGRILDGSVKIYSPKFILVKWITQFRDMPHTGQQKFDSAEAAITFIKANFVRGSSK